MVYGAIKSTPKTKAAIIKAGKIMGPQVKINPMPRIPGVGNETSGDSYNGYFKVIATDTGYSVVFGADPDSANCGYVNAGNKRVAVPKKDFATADVAASGVFYIETTYVSPDFKPVIKFAASLPEAEDGKDIASINILKDNTPNQIKHDEHYITRWV